MKEEALPFRAMVVHAWKVTNGQGEVIFQDVTSEGIEFNLENLPYGWDGDRWIGNVSQLPWVETTRLAL